MGKAAANTGRKPISCRAIARSTTPSTAPTSRAFGASRRSDCRAGPLRLRDAGRARNRGRRARAACVWFEPGCFGTARRTHRAAPARLSTFWSSRISFFPRPRQLADVVLPAAQWAEEEGTMTNLEGRVLSAAARGDAAARGANGSRNHVGLAERLGSGGTFRRTAEVFEELRRASAGGVADYSASPTSASRKKTACSGPVPSEDHPGTPRLFLDRFATPDGRARFHAVDYRAAAEEPDARVSALSDDRPRDAALSIGHADAARASSC